MTKRILVLLLLAMALPGVLAVAPNPGHDPLEVGPGTFATGNFTFNGNVTVNGTIFMNGSTVCTADNNYCSGSGSISGSGAANYVALWENSENLTYDVNGLFYDPSTNQLAIGTATADGELTVRTATAGARALITTRADDGGVVHSVNKDASDNGYIDINYGAGSVAARIGGAGDNFVLEDFAVGTTSTSYKFEVSGTGRFTGNLDANSGIDVTGAAITGSSGLTISAGTVSLPEGEIDTDEILNGTIEAGDLLSGNTPSNGQVLAYNSTSGGFYWTSGAGGLWTDSGGDATYSSGNVGIGTTTPFDLLTLQNGSIGFNLTGGLELISTQDFPDTYATERMYSDGFVYYTPNLRIVDVNDPENMQLRANVDPGYGEEYNLHADGNYVYLTGSGGGNLVYTFDVTNKSNPVEIASYDAGVGAQPIVINTHGPYLFVGFSEGNGGELYIVDNSDPTNPSTLGKINLSHTVFKQMYVYGDRLYVSTHDGASAEAYSLNIVDISDPTSPSSIARITGTYGGELMGFDYPYLYAGSGITSISSYYIGDDEFTVLDTLTTGEQIVRQHGFVAGDYLFVNGDTTGTFIVDVSRPDQLQEVGELSPYAIAIGAMGQYLVGFTENTSVAMYRLPGVDAPAGEFGSLQAGILSTETSATIGGELEVRGGLEVDGPAFINKLHSRQTAAFHGDVGIGTATPSDSLTIDQGGLYVTNDRTFEIIDQYSAGGYTYGGFYKDGFVYVIPTMDIFDVSDPYTIKEVSSFDPGSSSEENYIHVEGDLLFLGGDSSPNIRIYDVSDKDNPYMLVDYDSGSSGGQPDPYVVGSTMFIGYTNNTGPELYAVDITDPTNPILLGTLELGARVRNDMYSYQDRLYFRMNAGDGLDNYTIVNISDPRNMNLIDTDQYGYGQGILGLDYPYLYVSDNLNDVEVLDVGNDTLVSVASWSVGAVGTIETGTLQGNYLYVGREPSSSSQDITILDVSSPSDPVLIATYNSNTSVLGVQGNYIIGTNVRDPTTIRINGIDVPSAEIGSLDVGGLEVDGESVFGRKVSIQDGLNVRGSTKLDSLGVQGQTVFMGNVGIGVAAPNESLSVLGNINASGTITATAGLDLAEKYQVFDGSQAGHIMAALDSDTVERATRATASYTVGVISTQPGMILNKPGLVSAKDIAIAGRVPVLVDTSVARGDYITVGDTPGVGTVATQASFVVGRALEDSVNGTVVILVEPGYFSPQVDSENQLVGAQGKSLPQQTGDTLAPGGAIGRPATNQGTDPQLLALVQQLQTKVADLERQLLGAAQSDPIAPQQNAPVLLAQNGMSVNEQLQQTENGIVITLR